MARADFEDAPFASGQVKFEVLDAMDCKNEDGYTPLLVKFEVLDAVDCKNEDGYTPLLVASHKGYARIVQR
ncbi:hypothetical protein T484DRAFT_1851660, partial [Baffinella frigidus]